ncbi:MAG: glycosyltransferase [Cytophagaceae bacterium]|jgi:glycosyltransferase involved in cell wall biosynthesis|nr:glycosyltransferase [Cytophagaceae bacterium]
MNSTGVVNKPVISIITVVFNGVDTLERTLRSVAEQTYSHIEYIIVDGNSNDGTQYVIKQYEKYISKWISEPDNGLYDAMNKGIKIATGDYLWFINSGDEIASPDVIQKIFESPETADVYYGETVMVDNDGRIIGIRRLTPPDKLNWKDFRNGMLVSHQSVIVSRRISKTYNTAYRFSADFEWTLLALKYSKNTVNTCMILSKFLDGGLTKKNIVPGLKERFSIMKKYYGLLPTIFYHIPIGFRFMMYYIKNRRF